MIQLRGGHLTADIRLDRLVYFDERSRQHPVRAALGSDKLRSYTWSLPELLDQGFEGSCIGASLGHELLAIPKKIKNVSMEWARERIYWEAQKIDPWPGGSYPGASPFYEGTSVLAGVKVIHTLGYIGSYKWAFSTDEVRQAVGHIGPGVAGLNWYEGMGRPNAEGFIKPTGRWRGGHAIIIRGVNNNKGYFLLTNSWGRGWGTNGDCKLSFEDFDKLLHEQGEFVVPLERKII